MNRTFTFKVDSTIPQLDAIIEDIMDDFSVARKSRRLHIDTDYLPVVVMLDPDHKPERWAPQNHNWRVVDTLFNVRLIDQSLRLILAYTQDDEGNHLFLIDRIRSVDKHPLITAYPAIRPMLGTIGRDYRWNLSFSSENNLELFAKTMRHLGLNWATAYDAEQSEYKLQVDKPGTPLLSMSRDHELLVTIKTVLSNLPFALRLHDGLPKYKEIIREQTNLD